MVSATGGQASFPGFPSKPCMVNIPKRVRKHATIVTNEHIPRESTLRTRTSVQEWCPRRSGTVTQLPNPRIVQAVCTNININAFARAAPSLLKTNVGDYMSG